MSGVRQWSVGSSESRSWFCSSVKISKISNSCECVEVKGVGAWWAHVQGVCSLEERQSFSSQY